jgi:hypothetical protein
LVNSCKSVDAFNLAVKSIPDFIREKITDSYKLLRSAGWYGIGVNSDDRIIWYYVVDSRPKEIRELEGRQFTPEECRLARASVHKRMGRVDSVPRNEPWEYDQPGDDGC